MATQHKVPIFNGLGQVTDVQHNPYATEDYVDSALSIFDTGEPDYDDLPAKTVLVLNKSAGVWPGVPTDREDIVIIWKGASPAPGSVTSRTLGLAEMLIGVDIGLFS